MACDVEAVLEGWCAEGGCGIVVVGRGEGGVGGEVEGECRRDREEDGE